jgi:hypothetical protein
MSEDERVEIADQGGHRLTARNRRGPRPQGRRTSAPSSPAAHPSAPRPAPTPETDDSPGPDGTPATGKSSEPKIRDRKGDSIQNAAGPTVPPVPEDDEDDLFK